jgi:hypothetical protein
MTELDWRCERCGVPATTITVDGSAAVKASEDFEREDRAVHERFRREGDGGLVLIPFSELPMPHTEHWAVVCDDCLTEEEWQRTYYWIGAERIGTVAAALDWTLHLTETKDWLNFTDWRSLMRRVVLGRTPVVAREENQ